MKVATNVEVIGRTEFDRVNHHTRKPVVETFAAITMRDVANGRLYVTYTRIDTEFARSVSLGQTFLVSGLVKEERNDEYGPHMVLTRCKVGQFKTARQDEKRAEKKLARLQKLGLA